jgi:hypothetical protein
VRRPRNRRRAGAARTAAVAIGVVFVLSALSSAQSLRPPRWRTGRYDRQGAEIWLEAPRFVAATGKGYRNGAKLYDGATAEDDKIEDLDLEPGWGFGFGLMFALSGNVAVEGRVVQTNHDVSASGLSWDLDQFFAGGRYVFRHDRRVQIFLGAGGARHALEFDTGESLVTDFQRLSGFGWYVSTGVDYVASSRWVVSLRADYVSMEYGSVHIGTSEEDIADPFDGSAFGVSLSVNYRVPVFW